MRKIRLMFILAVLALTLCLSGCDIFESFVPEIDVGGDEINPPSENEENEKNEDKNDNAGTNEHVCDFKHKSYIESTCTVAGKDVYECACGKTRENPRELAPHTEQIIPATEATGNSPAKTEGKKCSVCGCILVQPNIVFADDYGTPSKYDGTYAYNYLATLKNGEKLTKLYNSIDECADLFHVSGEDAGDNLVVAEINFGELGISSDEAIATWSAYTYDHPLYYWISKKISYTEESLSLKVDEEYKSGSVRNAHNSEIYAVVEDFLKQITSDSEYSIALTLHDLIISSGDYAYESDGVTPKDDNYAHNILGILEMGEGVCESYAKSFQMMLNYCGIENVFVSGYAREPHAWNLVKLDDGKWYWCDLTWDDKPGFMWGVSHRYFCVNGSEALMNMDGPWTVADETFDATHTPSAKCDTGIDFAYTLPEVSDSSFAASGFILRDTFKLGDFTYAFVDYKSVQLVKIEKQGDVVIPESVEYGGRNFDVVSIGRIDENGLFKTGSLVSEYYNSYGELSMAITSVSIPKTVSLIWDDALGIQTLEQITVSADNETYTSVDGVLFTKDLSTLVKYPSARSGESYALTDATRQIAAYAFSMSFSNLELANLQSLTLGVNTQSAGIAHFGYGYADTKNGNLRAGEWERIAFYLKGEGQILTKSGDLFSPSAA